jgi:hypothetical protein
LKHQFEKVDVREQKFSREIYELIIFWLKSLEYKFQALDLPRNLNKVKDSEYIPYIGKMPISMFQGSPDTSPSKVFSNLRLSLKTLSIKSKAEKFNSLCTLYKNTDFHFFHSTNNFIFIELAEYGVAFFYFFKRTFDSHESAGLAAQEMIKQEYSGKIHNKKFLPTY